MKAEVREVAPSSLVVALQALPLSTGYSLSSEDESRPVRVSKIVRHKKKRSSASSSEDRSTWSMRQSLIKWYRSSITNDEEQLKAPKLQVIHPVNFAFVDAQDYSTNRIHNHSIRYSGKLLTHLTKLSKQPEKILKPHRVDDNDSETIFLFMSQCKRACYSSEYQRF